MECESFMTGLTSGQVMLKKGEPELIGQMCLEWSFA